MTEMTMTEDEARLWAQAEDKEPRLPLLSAGEARAVVRLLQIISSSDGEGSDVAYELAGTLARRLPDEG